ncbi:MULTISPECIES: argininosuccinate lyase [unclassified Shinella]|uniref:argininosuccinate lyase n=1 Tax=unclassified Shinella TaxID=2643062 RepID=UPI00225D2E17|nr:MULTISPECIES: argininosuccinate lyase [unclassified Shinella]MCO5141209.1 argininosuccinate lyase [Shinella sp.]MDC7260067.1 argininosuccinate lyase [Shinella sp. YE25]CAI0341477.1 Argininosuccinate lyase 2 [Rhizobiaceae bacterium]CAK7261106.1 Argininosuccinate lyase 2 [Shinella sp. WSC3-e]
MKEQATLLWGGRFSSGPSPELAALSRSNPSFFRLSPEDIAGSRAHARELARADVLTGDELATMLQALDAIAADVAAGREKPKASDEDLHTFHERLLVERLGTLGGKLRAGRSRNDQTANNTRLYLRRTARRLVNLVLVVQDALATQATEHVETVMPGFTHLQPAQPVSLGHHLMAHAQSLSRDIERFIDWDRRFDRSPLGAAALAGSAFARDTESSSRDLGYARPCENSIDAVASRDVVSEFLFVTAMLGVNLSRLSEEICIWASRQFAWVKLHDSYSTGSSIMPQKKNPDIAELARGMSGTMIGNLAGILATLKAMPLAYNRDLAEDKRALFETIDLLDLILPAFAGMVATMTFDTGRMAADAPRGFTLATEVADWLVRQGIPFAHAHEISGATVRYCEERDMELDGLTEADLPKIDAALTADVLRTIDPVRALAERFGQGGTAPARVREQIAAFADTCTRQRAWAARGLEGVALEPTAGVAA